MSISRHDEDGDGGGTVGDGFSIEDALVPKLVQETRDTSPITGGAFAEIERSEFEPLVVTRMGGTLPWDTDSTQLQCGETVTSNDGDHNIRLVYEVVCTHTQFQTLQSMRDNPEDVKLISRAYKGPVTFDEMRFDRIPDANGAIIRGEGHTKEPLYEVQLQSKETEE